MIEGNETREYTTLAMRASFYYVLSARPLILGSTGALPRGGQLGRPSLAESISQYSLLQHFSWLVRDEASMRDIVVAQRNCARHGVDYHAMVSSQEEDELRSNLNVAGAHVGHNIHVNEHVFRPMALRKDYDAIYVAQLKRFKRHELACDVERLLVVSYGGDLHEFCPSLTHAAFNRGGLGPDKVAMAINCAHAGLCLSAEEGQMNASAEYLVCGIPVVNTPSRGGREEYFDESNCLTVPPKPGPICEAVEHWKQISPNADEIRRGAITKLQRRRLTYCEYVADLIDDRSGQPVDPDWLMTLYFGLENGMSGREIEPRSVGEPGAMARFRLELPHHVPIRDSGVRVRRTSDVLELDKGGKRLTLSKSAEVIWELCDGHSSIGEIVEQLGGAFPMPAGEMRRDVLECLQFLSSHGVIHAR